MKSCIAVGVLATLFAAGAEDVVLENETFRLAIGSDAIVRSWRLKATGEELLQAGVRLPLATMTQERPYDNEYKLMLPAKPWTHKANGLSRAGDELRITFEDEFNVAVVKVGVKPAYMTFTLERIDYVFEDFGDKRRTEVDALEFLRLPVRPRAHVGRILNCTWEEKGAACAILAGNVRTHADVYDREDGALVFTAEADERVALEGTTAVLVATPQDAFLEAIDGVERDLGLPRGVASRRRRDYAASYAFAHDTLSPANVDAYCALVNRLGLRTLMTCVSSFAATHGTYPYRAAYPRGDADLAEVGRKVRAAGLRLGVHVYASKCSTNDALFASGRPDPRFATVTELFLDEPVDAAATTLKVQGNPALLRRERGRGVLLAEGELIVYDRVSPPARLGAPFTLEGCVRGSHRSSAAPHARLACLRHLDVDDWPYWVRFDQNSSIQAEVAARLAHFWKTAGFSFIYFDGAEDVPKPFWHYVPRANLAVWQGLDPAPVYAESALKSHFGWHLHSRGNAFDVFAPERLREAMKKYVLRTARQDADDFSSVNFGWLSFRRPERKLRKFEQHGFLHRTDVNTGVGMQSDMYDYAASKALAYRAPLALQISLRDVEHPHFADIAASLKGWEDAKLDDVFTPEEKARLADPDREFFLWPFNAEGVRPEIVEWRSITPFTARPYRAFSYRRAGKSGIVCWHVFESAPPALEIPGTTRRTALGRTFFESDEDEAALADRFLKATRGGRLPSDERSADGRCAI